MSAPAILYLDAETSGPINRRKPLDDPSQPWCVSIAAELTEIDGTSLAHFALPIRPEERRIKAEAEKIHGISTREAATVGVGETAVLGALIGLVNKIPFGGHVVGYGVDVYRDVVLGLLMRRGDDTAIRAWTRPGLVWLDLAATCAPFCRVPSSKDDDAYQAPSLDVAGEVLCGIPPRMRPHSSYDDATRARRVHAELVKRGAVLPPTIKERGAA